MSDGSVCARACMWCGMWCVSRGHHKIRVCKVDARTSWYPLANISTHRSNPPRCGCHGTSFPRSPARSAITMRSASVTAFGSRPSNPSGSGQQTSSLHRQDRSAPPDAVYKPSLYTISGNCQPPPSGLYDNLDIFGPIAMFCALRSPAPMFLKVNDCVVHITLPNARG